MEEGKGWVGGGRLVREKQTGGATESPWLRQRRKKEGLEGECWRCSCERKEPGIKPMA